MDAKCDSGGCPASAPALPTSGRKLSVPVLTGLEASSCSLIGSAEWTGTLSALQPMAWKNLYATTWAPSALGRGNCEESLVLASGFCNGSKL